MRRYDAILLDVGSTLLEYRPAERIGAWAEITGASPGDIDAAWRAARSAARELSGRETREEFERFQAEVCAEVLDCTEFGGDRRAAIEAMSDAWVRVGWEPFPDVHRVLSNLRALGYRLGVVSNWTATLELTLAHVGLAAHFDVVACSAVVGAMKPSLEIFQHALNALAVEAARALYVGDHYEVDVLGARDAGMDAVLIARDEAVDELPDTTTTIRSLDDLFAVLDATS